MSRSDPNNPDVVLNVGFDRKELQKNLDFFLKKMTEMQAKVNTSNQRIVQIQQQLTQNLNNMQQANFQSQLNRHQQIVVNAQQAANQYKQAWANAYQQLLAMQNKQPGSPPTSPGGGGLFGGGGGGGRGRGFWTSLGFGLAGAGRGIPGIRGAAALSIGYGFGGVGGLAGAASGVALTGIIVGVQKLIASYEELYKKAFQLSSGHAQLQNTIDQTTQTFDQHFYPALKKVQDQEILFANWIDANQDKVGHLADLFANLAEASTEFVGATVKMVTGAPSTATALDNITGRLNNMVTAYRKTGNAGLSIITGALSSPNNQNKGYIESLGGMDEYRRLVESNDMRMKYAHEDLGITDFNKKEHIRELEQANQKKRDEIQLLQQVAKLDLDINTIEFKKATGQMSQLDALEKILGVKQEIGTLEVETKKKEEDEARKAVASYSSFGRNADDPSGRVEAEKRLLAATEGRVKAEKELNETLADGWRQWEQMRRADPAWREPGYMYGNEKQVPYRQLDRLSRTGGSGLTRFDFDVNQEPMSREDLLDFSLRRMAPQAPYRPISNVQALENSLGVAVNRLSAFNSVISSATGSVAVLIRSILDVRHIQLPNGEEVGKLGRGLGSIFQQKYPDPNGSGGTVSKFTVGGFLQGAAAIGGIAASVFGVISALRDVFTKAAKQMAESIGKEVSRIEKVANQSGKLNDAIQQLESQRSKAINDLGNKKGGQKQLETLLPQIDEALDSIKSKQKEIVDNFQKGLSLFDYTDSISKLVNEFDDLDAKVKEFINAAGESESTYNDALEFIKRKSGQLMTALQQQMEDLKNTWTQGSEDERGNLISLDSNAYMQQVAAFEQLIKSAGYNSLTDDQKKYYNDLLTSLGKTNKLEGEIGSLEKSRAKLEKDYAKQATKDLKDIADLKQEIIDLNKEEQDQITSITNEGIAERQKTTQQDKAQRIADLQDQAKKKRAELEDALAAIQEEAAERTKAYNEQIQEINDAEQLEQESTDNQIARIINETERAREAYLKKMQELQDQVDKVNELETTELTSIQSVEDAWTASLQRRLDAYSNFIDNIDQMNSVLRGKLDDMVQYSLDKMVEKLGR